MSAAFGCVGTTIRLQSGKYLDLRNPSPDQFDLMDVAGALSKICRFGGQIDRFYSVAQHSYLCSKVGEQDGLPIETQVALLFHDAAEAFVGDMVKPLKQMLPEFSSIELRIESAIAEKWQIDFVREEFSVKKIDREMLIAERRRLFSPDAVKWTGEDEVRRIRPDIPLWFPPEAEEMFVLRARMLGVK